MNISFRVSKEEKVLIKKYAKINNMSVSNLMRQTIMEKIEDEIDLAAYNKAIEEYRQNPKTYTLDDIQSILNFK